MAKTKKTRRRLGQCFPMKGFYYFVQVNVPLANRGLPQVDLPPPDTTEPRPLAPLLSQLLVQYSRGLLRTVPPELQKFLRPPLVRSG